MRSPLLPGYPQHSRRQLPGKEFKEIAFTICLKAVRTQSRIGLVVSNGIPRKGGREVRVLFSADRMFYLRGRER